MSLRGRARLLPGEGFAVPDGLGRLALRASVETRRRPVRHGAVTTRRCETERGPLWVRVGPRRDGEAVVLVHGAIVSSRYLLPLASELAGNSFGAQIAVEAALRHSAAVGRLVLIGPTVDPAARSLLRQYVRWQRNAPDEHLSVLPVMARDLADLGRLRATRVLGLMLADRLETKLPAVTAPTLVIRGGRDRVAPDRWVDAIVDALPDGRLAVLPGYAHMPHWSGALAVAPLVRAFLD